MGRPPTERERKDVKRKRLNEKRIVKGEEGENAAVEALQRQLTAMCDDRSMETGQL
jgi:hypothetical protein